MRTKSPRFSSRLIEPAVRGNWREHRRLVDIALDKEAGNGVAGVRGHE